MDVNEMSDLFDVLYNNITSNQAPGLNEYEKSVFLTKAQDELVKNYFLPQSNPKQAGFDDNPKRQIDFSKLITTSSFLPTARLVSIPDPRGYMFDLTLENEQGTARIIAPILFIINESVLFYDAAVTTQNANLKAIRQVVPLKYDEYSRLMSKPFKEPLKNQAWRLIADADSITGVTGGDVTIVCIVITSADKSTYSIAGPSSANNKMVYQVRYVKRPRPIILTDLSSVFGEGLSIHGETDTMDCELDPSIHEEIVQRAVELAKVAWDGTLQSEVQAGQRSE